MTKSKPAYTAWSIRQETSKPILKFFSKYSLRAGQVMWAWNELQKQYQNFFMHVVSPQNHRIAQAAWDSLVSDQAQRDMLEAAIKAALTNPIEKQALKNIRWALRETKNLTAYRNIAAHMPVEIDYVTQAAVPDRTFARSSAAKLVRAIGDKLLFEMLIAELGVLQAYVFAQTVVLFGVSPGAFPRKPRLRLHKKCQEIRRRMAPPKPQQRKRRT